MTMAMRWRLCWVACWASLTLGADWPQFRGPGGLGTSDEKGLPSHWSDRKGIVWKSWGRQREVARASRFWRHLPFASP